MFIILILYTYQMVSQILRQLYTLNLCSLLHVKDKSITFLGNKIKCIWQEHEGTQEQSMDSSQKNKFSSSSKEFQWFRSTWKHRRQSTTHQLEKPVWCSDKLEVRCEGKKRVLNYSKMFARLFKKRKKRERYNCG